MTAHVRKGFEKWSDRQYGAASLRMALQENAFRAGVRFEQGRGRAASMAFWKAQKGVMRKHMDTRQALATALEILSRTPAGKREADKLREVLK